MDLLHIKKLKIMNDAKEALNKTEDIYNIKARDIFNNSIKKAISANLILMVKMKKKKKRIILI